MSRMNVYMYVTVIFGAKYEWWMWSEEGWKRNSATTLAYSYQKTLRGSVGSMSPSDSKNAVNSTYALTINAWKRDLKFNPDIFWNRNWGLKFCHSIPPPPSYYCIIVSLAKWSACRWLNSQYFHLGHVNYLIND